MQEEQGLTPAASDRLMLENAAALLDQAKFETLLSHALVLLRNQVARDPTRNRRVLPREATGGALALLLMIHDILDAGGRQSLVSVAVGIARESALVSSGAQQAAIQAAG